MAAPTQSTSRPRAPLAELPLHSFVSQSLAYSPNSSPEKLLKTPSRSRSRSPSSPRSQRNPLSLSPHKQVLLQNHRLVRKGSAASPTSSNPSTTSNQAESMTEAELSILPRRLFSDRASRYAGSDLSLEASPIPSKTASAGSRFSPRNVGALSHHSTNMPTTPKGAGTTPLNLRQHRPPHTTGPKPASLVEPSPTTQRMSEPRLPMSRRHDHASVPTTPSRARTRTQPALKATATEEGGASREMTPLEEPTQFMSTAHLQSLPKKKDRVSRIEVAMAHEEAVAGPIASPSPRKKADYFSPASDDVPAFGLAETQLRSDSVSDRRHSLAALGSLTDLRSKALVDSLTLTRSGLFLGVVARPLPGWTVYEDPISSSMQSDDTAPSQDHSLVSSPVQTPDKPSVPSTPNKENRVPDDNFLASKVVPIALPDRTYSSDAVSTQKRSSSRIGSAAASPATAASKKRGTGGRLSLLADAGDGDATKDSSQQIGDDDDETTATVLGSGKKAKSRGASTTFSPKHGARKASQQQRKASGGKSRKSSSAHQLESPQRLPDSASMDSIASRTRSRTRA